MSEYKFPRTHDHTAQIALLRLTLCRVLCAVWCVGALLLAACSSTRHVPEGKLLLDRVTIKLDSATNDITPLELTNYLRQTENHRVLGGLKLQLGLYNMSGKDSTKWINRWIRRLGSAPVIYDSALTTSSERQLHTALYNLGYMDNVVNTTVDADSAKRKARVKFDITLNRPYRISSIAYDIADDSLRHAILRDSIMFPIKPGDLFDHKALDGWRQSITDRLRSQGYFAFTKEFITFIADTLQGSHDVDLTLTTTPEPTRGLPPYRRWRVREVNYVTGYDPVTMREKLVGLDSIEIDGIVMYYDPKDRYLRGKVLAECNHIERGELYNVLDVQRTYQALSRLSIVKNITIDMRPVGEVGGEMWVDAYVLMQRTGSQSLSLSLEGTNSEGDLGFGIGLDYAHRNIMKGSERFNAKFRMSYESLSGNLGGLINNNYSEYSGEVGITYPKFKFPFLSRDFKKTIQASTELVTNFNYQKRPEYTRIIAGAAWRYLWTEMGGRMRHTFNLLDLNYVYLPASRLNFLDDITNPLLRYSYENHFIMRLGYNFYRTNKQPQSAAATRRFQNNVYTVRAAAETAGNVLYGISQITGAKRNTESDSYEIFGIRYSQYFKLEGDYMFTHNFSPRSSVAFRVGAGVAVPYGNSTVLPFEKRFYSGGANSVRGWGVRTLGPGSFAAGKSQSNFIYQCGDIRFDANIEFRNKVFWVIELGTFIDAGNIWTIRNYEDQPGGVFKFNKFYEQIAAAYGIGIRMDFTYFLLRFDLGMKAHNPASGVEHWPLFHPKWSRDREFHFSVGYPF